MPPPGEEAALRRWRAFLERRRSTTTPTTATDPGADGTSRLSPYLKLGVVHPRTLLADLAGERRRARATYETELAWREFYADVLLPPAAHRRGSDLRPRWRGMRYDEPEDAIEAWRDGHHRVPDRRRRDAPAARRGLDAQPGADDHRQLPHQGPARVVAGRGAALPRPPRRRRHRLEQPRLAVGRGHGHRRVAVLPGVQPGDPGREVRPGRRLRAALGARARAPARQGGARAVGARRRLRARLPASGSSTTRRSDWWRWTATSAGVTASGRRTPPSVLPATAPR